MLNIPAGWKLVAVNEAFDDLMFWLDRCHDKGHLDNCYDLVAPWEAFEYGPAPAFSLSVAAASAQDERQAFEAWAKTQADTWLLVGGLQWSPGTNDYASTRTNAAWEAWKARASIAAPAAGDALDAARYRWLRDPQTDVALVLDKRTGYVPEDESVRGVGGYYTYEYRAGEELDAAIDAALAAQVPQQGEA